MKQFKDLEITGLYEQSTSLIDAVSSGLPSGWHRDLEAEGRMDKIGLEGTDAGFAFARDATDGDPPAQLFLHYACRRLRVSNIVPCDDGQLSMSQYNAILDEFAEMVRTHLPADTQVDIEVTSDEAAITDWVSSDAAKLLNFFSDLANRSIVHPLDFERWVRFLLQTHREGSALHSSFLARWLAEELGWPPERAHDLARDYEFARDLLKAYDAAR